MDESQRQQYQQFLQKEFKPIFVFGMMANLAFPRHLQDKLQFSVFTERFLQAISSPLETSEEREWVFAKIKSWTQCVGCSLSSKRKKPHKVKPQSPISPVPTSLSHYVDNFSGKLWQTVNCWIPICRAAKQEAAEAARATLFYLLHVSLDSPCCEDAHKDRRGGRLAANSGH